MSGAREQRDTMLGRMQALQPSAAGDVRLPLVLCGQAECRQLTAPRVPASRSTCAAGHAGLLQGVVLCYAVQACLCA